MVTALSVFPRKMCYLPNAENYDDEDDDGERSDSADAGDCCIASKTQDTLLG